MKHLGMIICILIIVILGIATFYEYSQCNDATADLKTLGHAYNGIVANSGVSPAALPVSAAYNTLNVNSTGQVMQAGSATII